jgi:uncharacterized protein YndB with AHSA1/START domain
MTRIEHVIDFNSPIESVYEYYTNPDSIKQAWPNDVVKESGSESTAEKNAPGSEMRIKGEFMGSQEEVRLAVVERAL